MKKFTIFVALALVITASMSFAYLVDTGQPPIPAGTYGLSYHSNNLSEVYYAAEFTLAQAATITDIQTYMINIYGGTATVAIYGDGGEIPDVNNQLFRSNFSTSSLPNMVYGWYGLSGLNWNLPAGTYWVAFEATLRDNFYSCLPWGAPFPMKNYAYFNGSWMGADNAGIGLRISGSVGDGYPATVSLPQSGQTKCYDTTGTETTCAGTGQDGDRRTGVAWPNPRFSVSGNCVSDNLTGLMWSQNANLAGGITWTGGLDWVASMNSGGGLCGYTDWRLPNINELRSLVHSGYKQEICGGTPCYYLSDWLQSKGFANIQPNYYWSSTTSAYSYGTTYTWSVGLDVGYVLYGSETESFYVWPVRGGSDAAAAPAFKTGQTTSYHAGDDGLLERGVGWPSPRFTVSGIAGTVTDNLTGLTWLKNGNCFGSQTWANALSSANNLANGNCGLSDGSHPGDWRLPNREELESLVNFAYYGPGLSNSLGTGKWVAGDPFDNVQSSGYWSSTTFAFSTSSALIVHMHGGSAYDVNKMDGSYVWPVRGGQSGAFAHITVSGSGTVISSPAGINCGMTCSASFAADSVINFTAIPAVGSIFSGWSGDAGCGNTLTIHADKNCTANFAQCAGSPVTIGVGPKVSIGAAYADAADTDTIKAIGSTFEEALDFSSPKNITLSGGYDCDLNLQTGLTYITGGALTISAGTVVIDRFVFY